MKFFFPDSQDFVDPEFNFVKDEYSPRRERGRTDRYAHEMFRQPVQDGILISKVIVTGYFEPDPPGGPKIALEDKTLRDRKYSEAQALRLLREGAPEFFRISTAPNKEKLEIIGDCGAFSYHELDLPPFTSEEVLTFYEDCKVDLGISVDHVVFGMDDKLDQPGASVPAALRERQELTLTLAREFFNLAKGRKKKGKKTKHSVVPVGVAQGWSPNSYLKAVKELKAMGYWRIALGGLAHEDLDAIARVLAALAPINDGVEFHLLGVAPIGRVQDFLRLKVTSFDTTSPLLRSFKDQKKNYDLKHGHATAIRVPQSHEGATAKMILSGELSQSVVRSLEKECLAALDGFQEGRVSVDEALALVLKYEAMVRPHKSTSTTSKRREAVGKNADAYRKTLLAAPWKSCRCDICRKSRHHVILFRGSERNRRRGFHNVYMLYKSLQAELGRT